MSINILKKVFLHDFHELNHAKFVSFSGYSMPINYKLGIIKEHLHVRNSAGIFDVSHMGQILISPLDCNKKLLEKYIPLNFTNLKINKSYYSFLLNEHGGVIDDLIISKIIYQDNIFFYIVYNAGRKKEDEIIFKDNLIEYKFLKNNSLIAIQGPKANNLLNFIDGLKDMLFMESKVFDFSNELLIISRSGYTGEDGFEISIPNSIVLDFITFLMSKSYSKLCGLGCRDSLRLEAGLSLYGNELNEEITPIEANLSWSIHKERLEDVNLNGHKELFFQYTNFTNKKKIGLLSLSKLILRSNMKLLDNKNNEIGIITSGGFSPTLGSSIGLGYVNSTVTVDENAKIFTLIRGNIEEIKIVKLPFVLHRYKKGLNYE